MPEFQTYLLMSRRARQKFSEFLSELENGRSVLTCFFEFSTALEPTDNQPYEDIYAI